MIGRALTEFGFYAVIMGCVHGVIAGAIALVATPGWKAMKLQARVFTLRLLVLNFSVFALGGVGSMIWGAVAWERWYVSADPIVTYQPFVPFGSWVLKIEFGGQPGRLIAGASVATLVAFWWLLSAGVWLGALAIAKRRNAGSLWLRRLTSC